MVKYNNRQLANSVDIRVKIWYIQLVGGVIPRDSVTRAKSTACRKAGLVLKNETRT